MAEQHVYTVEFIESRDEVGSPEIRSRYVTAGEPYLNRSPTYNVTEPEHTTNSSIPITSQ